MDHQGLWNYRLSQKLGILGHPAVRWWWIAVHTLLLCSERAQTHTIYQQTYGVHIQRHTKAGMHARKLFVITTVPTLKFLGVMAIPGCSDYNIELISNLAPSTNRIAPIANNRILDNSLLTSNFYSLYLLFQFTSVFTS